METFAACSSLSSEGPVSWTGMTVVYCCPPFSVPVAVPLDGSMVTLVTFLAWTSWRNCE